MDFFPPKHLKKCVHTVRGYLSILPSGHSAKEEHFHSLFRLLPSKPLQKGSGILTQVSPHRSAFLRLSQDHGISKSGVIFELMWLILPLCGLRPRVAGLARGWLLISPRPGLGPPPPPPFSDRSTEYDPYLRVGNFKSRQGRGKHWEGTIFFRILVHSGVFLQMKTE